MTNQAAQTMPELPEPFDVIEQVDKYNFVHNVEVYTADQMHQYARDYAAALSQTAGVPEGWMLAHRQTLEIVGEELARARDKVKPAERAWLADLNRVVRGMLAAAPSASGVHPDALPDGTLSKSTAKRLAAASVSERARELLAAEYRTHGWHEDAGRLCMGGDPASFVEDDALRVIERLIEQGDEDTHVITELGRLLAGIAVILKGPEPAGTAWSYHDLPELVASAISEPRQVAAEMKAWAHTKMAEQQSSRRDRMMVAEWAKRLLPESSFPVKDFDVEGMSITKEAAREAVKQAALEQALTQQRGECWPLNKNPKDGWTFDPSFLDEVKTRAEQSDIGEFAPCLEGVESVLIALRCMGDTTHQPSADAVRDGIRMDWLVSKAVEVRDPLRHGSRAMFHAQTASDEDEPHRTTLREQIDAAMADELESLLSGGSHA